MIAGRPCVLIADDDPVTLRFLQGAIERCGCVVFAATGPDAALRMLPAAPGSVDLLLLDRRMPGRDGVALLRELRARGIAAPAIATSAELDPPIVRSLHEAGFAATLSKPAPLADVHAMLGRFIRVAGSKPATQPVAEPTTMALLDDAVALAAVGGDRTALRALRQLFAAELEKIAEQCEVAAATPDVVRTGDRLHRLRASCGICGALRLRAATERLEGALRYDPAQAVDATREFLRVCEITQAALASAD